MSTAQLDVMMELAESRAEAYVHLAKSIIINQFGAAAEHGHTEVTVALAAAMMQHEGAQIVADSMRAASG